MILSGLVEDRGWRKSRRMGMGSKRVGMGGESLYQENK